MIPLSHYETEFQSTLPVRGATQALSSPAGAALISIHAPREGSDADKALERGTAYQFQSTLPVRGATFRLQNSTRPGRFQSTLPVRGATPSSFTGETRPQFQSTLPVRGATFSLFTKKFLKQNFNPRSP